MKWLFDVFSRRADTGGWEAVPVTETFRTRVVLLCRDSFLKPNIGDYAGEFWTEMHKRLEYLHGSSPLVPKAHPRNQAEDAVQFVSRCSSEHFLDFVEYIFQIDMFWRFTDSAAEMVESINNFFRLDDLPYHLTEFVQAERKDYSSGYEQTFIETTAYPKVVLREHQLSHENVIAPALALLTRTEFVHANSEFLEALED